MHLPCHGAASHEGVLEGTVNLTMRDCRANNNVGGGISVSIKKNDASTYSAPNKPLGVLIDNCSISGTGGPTDPANRCSHGWGYSIGGPGGAGGPGARGSIVIRNAVVEDTARAGILVRNVAPAGPDLSFENLVLRNVATETDCCNTLFWSNKMCDNNNCKGVCNRTLPTAPIMFRWEPDVGFACCAASFSNVTVHDAQDRPFFFLDESGFCPSGNGLAQCQEKWLPAPGNVQGQISVFNSHAGACDFQGMAGCVRINSGQDKGLVRGCNVTQQRRPDLLDVECNPTVNA